MDTRKLRELAALEPADFAYHADAIRRNAAEAADTIERLQERIEAIEKAPGAAAALRQITRVMKERDAALAENERLKAVLDGEAKQNAYDRSQGLYGDGMSLGREGE